jgi:hypothetical protein
MLSARSLDGAARVRTSEGTREFLPFRVSSADSELDGGVQRIDQYTAAEVARLFLLS